MTLEVSKGYVSVLLFLRMQPYFRIGGTYPILCMSIHKNVNGKIPEKKSYSEGVFIKYECAKVRGLIFR